MANLGLRTMQQAAPIWSEHLKVQLWMPSLRAWLVNGCTSTYAGGSRSVSQSPHRSSKVGQEQTAPSMLPVMVCDTSAGSGSRHTSVLSCGAANSLFRTARCWARVVANVSSPNHLYGYGAN